MRISVILTVVNQIPAIAVLCIMLSTGMSLNRSQLAENWRRLTPGLWVRLLLTTFIIPPFMALVLGSFLPVGRAGLASLYLIAVSPGAPLMTRNAARHGFDLQMAASYQVWGAVLSPLMIPVLVWAAALLFDRQIWISPGEVLAVVAKQQFAPLLAGMALVHFMPTLAGKLRRPLNLAGNLLVITAIFVLLLRLGPELMRASPWIFVAVLGLAGCCLSVARLLIPSLPTLAVSNVNRHVGLALLLSGAHVQNAQLALPVIAAYALAAPLIMAVYARTAHRQIQLQPVAT